jgi:RHS repeat-associated protein
VPSYVGPRDTVTGAGGPYTFPWTPTTGTFTVPGENASFAYDVLGNVTQANNAFARITRTYDAAGRLTTEVLNTSTWDTTHSQRWGKHTAASRYAYDLNSRRTVLFRPTGDSLRYVYHKQMSALDSLVGYGAFAYVYDNLGRVMSSTAPYQVTTTFDYDLDGQRWHRLQRGLEYKGPVLSDTTIIHADTLLYDARGKRSQAYTEVFREGYRYDGLGHADSVGRIAIPGLQLTEEKFQYSPLGNIGFSKAEQQYGVLDSTRHRYLTASGRVKATDRLPDPGPMADSSGYDADGNVTWFTDVHVFTDAPLGVSNPIGFAKYYYGADNKLRIADKRSPDSVKLAFAHAPDRWMNTFEEYRYDALGRRIAKRAQRRSCENYCVSTIERFVWDGSDLLQESRYPGRWDSPSDSLEVDTGYVMQKIWSPCPPATPCWDTTYVPKMFGSTRYEYDGTIDHPVSMRRQYYAKDTLALLDNVTVYPQYDAKGNAAGDTKNTSPLTDPGFQVNWPAADLRAYGFYASGSAPTSWFGSVITGGQDATGLQYKRNRYYNAEGGRFTQEDPIGLAGGMNLYGFASGDPVNFADRFGLCPDGVNATSVRQTGGRQTTIHCEDGSTEVRTGGTWAWRNYNPGNLRQSALAAGRSGGFAVFTNRATGHEAMWRQFSLDAARGMTLASMLEKYAPRSENDTDAYIAFVSMRSGVSASTSLESLTEITAHAVIRAMQEHEGWKAGSVVIRR